MKNQIADRLAAVAREAEAIRSSLSTYDPRTGSGAPDGRDGRQITGKARESAVAHLAELIADVREGKKPLWHLQEAMSTSDFPYMFGDVMYRQMLGNYASVPVTYSDYFRIMDVNDFRAINLYTLEGGDGRLEAVSEHAPYPETYFSEGKYTLQVGKYGRRYGISFEMLIQDDMNAFRNRPMVMALGARRSEEYLATTMLVDANGPHATFFSSGHANIITSNPPFGLEGLKTAITLLGQRQDSEGNPIYIPMTRLVVTPADEVAARELLGATEFWTSISGSNTDIHTINWLKGRVSLSVNPYIPVIASSCVTNPWFLIADPADVTQRPAFMFGFMRGRRNPQLFVKDPDARALGGGDINPTEGNFDTDSIDYKLRHIFGAAQGDPNMAMSSDGSGS